MRILAVDDEPYILELMPLLAARTGFPDVTTAGSGHGALEILAGAEPPFDCLILDVNMPGMDGIELCRRVRRLAGYKRAPIIMLTAMSERDYIDRAFQSGATDYATKPFDIHELGARLRVAWELVKTQREALAAASASAQQGSQPGRSNPPSLGEALVVEGARNLVDLGALTNYLRQLSRAGTAASHILAVSIDGIDRIHARGSADEFHYALREVAEAISLTLSNEIGLMSYAGTGVFVIVSNSASSPSPEEIEGDIVQILDDRDARFDDGAPMDLEVSIGHPVSPSFGSLADVEQSIARAIARAKSRSRTRHETPRERSFRRLRQ